MMSKESNCKTGGLNIILVMFILLLCGLTLSACNADDVTPQGETEYGLHLLGYYYGEDDSTIYAVVGLASDVGLDCARATATTRIRKENAFFNLRETVFTLKPSSIFSAVKDGMTQEVRVHDGITYNVLKIVFRYDTIYKSVKADGKMTKSGRYYMYSYLLDEASDAKTVNVVTRSQNTANWYSALLLAAAVLSAAGVAIAAAVKGKLCRQKTMTQNE